MRRIEVGKGRGIVTGTGAKVAVLTLGPALSDAVKAADSLRREGVMIDIFDMIWVKPLDTRLLSDIVRNHNVIISVEDGVVTGGFGSAISDWCRVNAPGVKVVTLGVPDEWVAHGTVAELKHDCGYDAEGIRAAVLSALTPDQ